VSADAAFVAMLFAPKVVRPGLPKASPHTDVLRLASRLDTNLPTRMLAQRCAARHR